VCGRPDLRLWRHEHFGAVTPNLLRVLLAVAAQDAASRKRLAAS
jgi:hypothetical protein